MSVEIEWVGSDDPPPPPAVEPERRRGSVATRAAVALLVAVGVLLSVVHPTTAVDGHGTTSLRIRPVSPAPAQVPVTLPSTDAQLELVRSLAGYPHPLTDVVRSGSPRGACPLVPLRTSPAQRTLAALRAVLPHYTQLDVGRTIDDSTALCSLTLRASDAAGTVLVVQIVPPSSGAPQLPFAVQEIDAGPDGSRVVLTTNALAVTGWSVTVGSDGPAADRPPVAALLQLAENPALRW